MGWHSYCVKITWPAIRYELEYWIEFILIVQTAVGLKLTILRWWGWIFNMFLYFWWSWHRKRISVAMPEFCYLSYKSGSNNWWLFDVCEVSKCLYFFLKWIRILKIFKDFLIRKWSFNILCNKIVNLSYFI